MWSASDCKADGETILLPTAYYEINRVKNVRKMLLQIYRFTLYRCRRRQSIALGIGKDNRNFLPRRIISFKRLNQAKSAVALNADITCVCFFDSSVFSQCQGDLSFHIVRRVVFNLGICIISVRNNVFTVDFRAVKRCLSNNVDSRSFASVCFNGYYAYMVIFIVN